MKTSQETDEIMTLLAKILAKGGTSLDVINSIPSSIILDEGKSRAKKESEVRKRIR